jgi:hypothetical protein
MCGSELATRTGAKRYPVCLHNLTFFLLVGGREPVELCLYPGTEGDQTAAGSKAAVRQT